jgi:glycosyltransferase 2 family protein
VAEPQSGRGEPRRRRSVDFGKRAARALTSLPARIVITAGLLTLIALKIDWDAVADAVSGAGWGWFVLAVLAIVASFVFGATRWSWLLAAADVPATRLRSLRAYFIGAFANNLLPTGFGGDLVRAVIVAEPGRALARSLTSVLVDRLSALGCLVLVGWLGIALDPGAVPARLVGLLAIVSAIAVIAAACAIVLLRHGRIGRFLPERLRPWASEVAVVLRGYLGDVGLLARVVAVGIGFQALIVVSVWLLGRTIGVSLPLALLAVVVPLVLIATLAPVTLGGFGVREGAFVALLGEVGVSSGQATVISLLSVAAMAIASLPGGAAMVLGAGREPGGGRPREAALR